MRIQANKHREMQVARTGGRKLFDRKRKKLFLEWFAATSNLGWAAEIAGVARQTVSKHLMSDPEFRGAYAEALQVSLLRLKAKTLETKKSEPKLDLDGEIEAPDIDIEPERALAILREHEREVKIGRKAGRMPRIASNAEVAKAVAARLKALAGRVARRGIQAHESGTFMGGGEEEMSRASQSPLHRTTCGHEQVQLSPGQPQPCRGHGVPAHPRSGEELA